MNALDVFKELVAGAGAGMAGVLLSHPLDTILVHQQVTGRRMGQACTHIIKAHGFHGFFRGLSVPFFTYGSVFPVYFITYSFILSYLTCQDEAQRCFVVVGSTSHRRANIENLASYKDIFLAGTGGGIALAAVIAPVDLIKIQIQARDKLKSPGVRTTIQKLVKLRGLRGFRIGMSATLLRELNSRGIFALVSKMYTDTFCEPGIPPSLYCSFMAGGVAGTAFVWTSLPIDTVKSRIQADRLSSPLYKNTLDCALKLYRRGGLALFYKGTLVQSLRVFPHVGTTFVAHSQLSQSMDRLYLRYGFRSN